MVVNQIHGVLLGETESGSAGEQPDEGEPSQGGKNVPQSPGGSFRQGHPFASIKWFTFLFALQFLEKRFPKRSTPLG